MKNTHLAVFVKTSVKKQQSVLTVENLTTFFTVVDTIYSAAVIAMESLIGT